MRKLTKYWGALMLLLLSLSAQAQMQEPEMADVLRENGKIFVVIIIMAIIFLGIAAYLFTLDRKISKMEKEQNQ